MTVYSVDMKTENKTRRKTTSCGGIPVRKRDGKTEILLIKQSAHKDSWGIPKGHRHDGESLEECAKREVREETGVQVELGQRLPNVGVTMRDEDKIVISWLCTVVGNDEPRHDDPDNEVADARWFHIDALPTIHQYQRLLIVAAIDLLAGRSVVLIGDDTAG